MTPPEWSFPIREAVDEDGKSLTAYEGGRMYTCARPGDHLILPFQCELCHFRNIQHRDPDELFGPDKRFGAFIIQANIDAFWSRQPSTVRANLREARRIDIEYAREFHIPSFTPPMGPFPLEDVQGMSTAVVILRRSLEKGKYEDKVQPNTFRKPQSTISNVTRAGVQGLGDAVGANDKGATSWISDGPTHTRWFGRFMVGTKRRVGEIVKQDEPITIEILSKVLEFLEEDWNAATTDLRRYAIALSGAWFCFGFCAALRGEETTQIEFAGWADSLQSLEDGKHPIPHFLLPINGPTKWNRDPNAKFWIPCAGTTQGSNLEVGKWATRYYDSLKKIGRNGGYLFSVHDGKRSKLSEFDEFFYPVLERVQQKTDLIKDNIKVREDFGIWRSLRRGVTAHAINMSVPSDLIRLINRWRSERDSGKRGKDMLEVYSVLKSLVPTVVKYSHKL